MKARNLIHGWPRGKSTLAGICSDRQYHAEQQEMVDTFLSQYRFKLAPGVHLDAKMRVAPWLMFGDGPLISMPAPQSVPVGTFDTVYRA